MKTANILRSETTSTKGGFGEVESVLKKATQRLAQRRALKTFRGNEKNF